MDNTCAVHYINAGTGRIADLRALAKSIRLDEIKMGIESVAVHIPGVLNVTADQFSRLQLLTNARDRRGERVLRKRLFKAILELIPSITIDGMASDDGHNTQLPRFCCPSDSVFELTFAAETVWMFPPEELIGPIMTFLHNLRRARKPYCVVLLVPERPRASWFHHAKHFRRVRRYVAGSDLFRE